jgi:uncharacterized protein YgbK (DUF1537 family)
MSHAWSDALPPIPDTVPDRRAIGDRIRAGAPKLVVLDDDPTGTQTVHGVTVLTGWSVPELAAALSDPRPCFFVLTNSRSLGPPEAYALNREVAANLKEASRETGRAFSLVSRSDSTLRGHFPGEVEVIAQAMAPVDAILLIPAFFEGGRYTIGNIQHVASSEGDRLVPVGETEFARDATFGYVHSNLRAWVEEKSGGRIPAGTVGAIPIEMLRREGARAVAAALLGFPRGSFVVVNAAHESDLEVFVHGLLLAEGTGRRYLFRTAASFVRVRAGISARDPLAAREIAPGSGRGLVVAGSFVERTTRQLESALALPAVRGIEVDVDRLAHSDAGKAEVVRCAAAADRVLGAGETAVVYTSRRMSSAVGAAGELNAGRVVSLALVEIIRAMEESPRFLLAKGGVTASRIAVEALGVRKAEVLGQAAPGVPVWRLGPESRFPGLPYMIFPGNVGQDGSLADLLRRLESGPS